MIASSTLPASLAQPARPARSLRLLIGSLVLLLVLPTLAQAQITITRSDVDALVGVRLKYQEFEADTPSNFASLAAQSGAMQTFDFRPFAYTLALEGVFDRQELDPASQPDIPLASDFASRGANVVTTLRTAVVQASEDSLGWSFEIVDTDGSGDDTVEFVGSAFIPDGETTASEFVFDPPRLDAVVPYTYEDTWSRSSTMSFDGMMGLSQTYDTEIVGWGTLLTPFGSTEVLQRKVSTSSLFSPTPSVTYEFFGKDARITATISVSSTGSVIGASLSLLSDDTVTQAVAAGATPSVSALGARVTLTQNTSPDAGTLDIFRFDTSPFNVTFSGSASSDDGSPITPNVMWEGRYYSITQADLTNFEAEVCIDIGSTPGVADSGKLVLVTRPTSADAWTPLDSFLDGTLLCASGLTNFSQFGIASDVEFNTLPVELSAFTVTADGTTALLAWETASETNNAGFVVQHRAPETSWRDAAFVAGAGTTDDVTSYRLRVPNLGTGAHGFRLQQVDLDGTTTLSPVRTVRIAPSAAFTLAPPVPNPARTASTLRLTLDTPGETVVAVYDLLGRRVRTLHDGPLPGGQEHRFVLDTTGLPDGLYLVRAASAGRHHTQKLTVLR